MLAGIDKKSVATLCRVATSVFPAIGGLCCRPAARARSVAVSAADEASLRKARVQRQQALDAFKRLGGNKVLGVKVPVESATSGLSTSCRDCDDSLTIVHSETPVRRVVKIRGHQPFGEKLADLVDRVGSDQWSRAECQSVWSEVASAERTVR